MRDNFIKSVFWGYLMLLIINVIEARSGIFLGIVQLILGLLVCLPNLMVTLNPPVVRRYAHTTKLLFSLSLLLGIIYKWYNAPNHLFTLFFLSLLLFYTEDEKHFKDNLRFFFIVLMGFATMHKVFNPNFMSGDFIAFRMVSGDFFQPIIDSGLIPGLKEVIAKNMDHIQAFVSTDPKLGESIDLSAGSLPYGRLIQPFVYAIIGMELLLTVGFILSGRSKLVLGFLLVFVATIGLIVSEYEFASTLLYMGFILCPMSYKSLRIWYRNVLLIYVLLALIENIT